MDTLVFLYQIPQLQRIVMLARLTNGKWYISASIASSGRIKKIGKLEFLCLFATTLKELKEGMMNI